MRGVDLSIIYYIYISYTSIYISYTSIWYTRRTVYDNESKRQESVAPLPSAAGYAPWARSGAGGATADFRLFGEVPGRGECPAPAPFTRSKRQIPRAKDQVRPSEGLHCLGTATPPCRGAHQASMLHGCAEVRERFDPDHPAANHTLPAALVQGQGTGASGTMEDTLRPRSTIGCSAWPCKLIVDLVMEIDLRPQSKGGCVFKEARSARTRTIVVLIVLNLAPLDLSESSMGCIRVRGWLRCTASPGKLVARLFRSGTWPGPGWAGTRTHWGHRWGKGSLLAACAPEHLE